MAEWWVTLVHAWRRVRQDNLSGLAAGAAFFAVLSILPALAAVVSLYGLVADPDIVQRHVTAIQGFLLPEAETLIAAWLQTVVQGPPVRFGIGLVVGVLLALWSAWSATAMLMIAVNVCYGEEEKRSYLRFNLRALALAVGLALFGIAALGLLAVLPAALAILPVSKSWSEVIALVRWPILAAIAILALAIVYRYTPHRARPTWQLFSWGTVTAAALWLFGSIAFTVFVAKLGSYDKTYGSLGAVIVLLLWFYLSAYVILIGAELNAEIARRAAQVGPNTPT